MEKLILIDGSGLIYRGFYAIPPFFKSPSGVQTNAVFGFSTILLSLLAIQKPDYMAVAFDKKGLTFRHKEFAKYKATRAKAPQELYDQIPLVKSVVKTFAIPFFEVEGYEADDILATIAKILSDKKDIEVFIATGDFDVFQIVRPGVSIIYPTKSFKESEIFGTIDVEKKYGLRPKQIPDYKGLAGDPSDNIPGVHGIGDKGATSLLQQYGTLENIYAHLDEIGGSLHKKLDAGQNSATMSKKLATLDAAVPLKFDLHACKVKHFNVAAVNKAFGDLGFKSLQKRLVNFLGGETKQGSLF